MLWRSERFSFFFGAFVFVLEFVMPSLYTTRPNLYPTLFITLHLSTCLWWPFSEYTLLPYTKSISFNTTVFTLRWTDSHYQTERSLKNTSICWFPLFTLRRTCHDVDIRHSALWRKFCQELTIINSKWNVTLKFFKVSKALFNVFFLYLRSR